MEYPPGIEPTRFPFPRCDSIISVWSDELVVISYHNLPQLSVFRFQWVYFCDKILVSIKGSK